MSGGAKYEKKEHRKEEKERFLQWKVLPHKHIRELLEITVDEVQSHLGEILGFRNQHTCMKEAALLDYYVSGFWWAKEASFTPIQLSFTMAVLNMLLDNIRAKHLGVVDNWIELTKALEASRQHPASEGDSAPLLGIEQAMALTDYIKNSLFQNYRLYELLFTTPREELLIGKERMIEVISAENTVAPLEEGMSADLYFSYLATPPTQELEEVKQEESGEVYQSLDQQNEKNGKEEEEEVRQYSIHEVKEVLGELAIDMLGNLQADFNEKLRLQEETYTARLECLQNSTSK